MQTSYLTTRELKSGNRLVIGERNNHASTVWKETEWGNTLAMEESDYLYNLDLKMMMPKSRNTFCILKIFRYRLCCDGQIVDIFNNNIV